MISFIWGFGLIPSHLIQVPSHKEIDPVEEEINDLDIVFNKGVSNEYSV